MSYEGDELVLSFVEDSREHLANIEQDLLDLESKGGGSDTGLVNSVFRAAHSIKGGAGMLGFNNVKSLAHKLENVLHQVRNDELDPSPDVVDVLLKGFDRLLTLVDNVNESDKMDIDDAAEPLLALLDPGTGDGVAEPGGADIRLNSGTMFNVDAVSLEQARRGGNNIYLVEYDLIHDIHLRDTYPLEVFTELEKSGRVLDCQLDFAAVGSLEGDFGNRIPFHVLFATILEADLVSTVARVDRERVVNIESALESGAVNVLDKHADYGPYSLLVDESDTLLRLPEEAGVESAEALREALLAGLQRGGMLQLDLSGVRDVDAHCLQLLCAVCRQHPDVSLEGGVSPEARRKAAQLGFTGASQTVLGVLLQE